jgi:hypothetical protein
MTHEERIDICKKCDHKKVDYEKGIVCDLTDERPDFEGTCPTFKARSENVSAYKTNIDFNASVALKPNQKRASYAIYALYANLVLAALTLIALLNENQVLKDYLNGLDVSESRFESTDLLTAVIAGLTVLVLIATAVLFIQWFRRAYYNLHLRTKHCKYTESMALWAWFIPIVNLFRPNEIMREMVDTTAGLLNSDDKSISKIKNFVMFWWIAWVINNISAQIIFRMNKNPDSAEEIIVSNNAELAVLPIEVIAAIFAILVIKSYSKLEEQLQLRENATDELELIGEHND